MALSRIQRTEIADDAINSAKIEDGTVLAADIITGQITNVKISSATGDKIAHTKLAVGTVAALAVGTGANQILQLDGTAKLPAISGTNLTNLPAGNLINALPVLDGTNLTNIVSDFTPITNSMARLALHLGAVDQLAKFNMIDQVIDDYEDATVDKSVSITVIPSNKFNSVAVEVTCVSEPDEPICNAAVLTVLICEFASSTTALLAVAEPIVTST